MWDHISYYFEKYPSQVKLVKFLMDNGLSIRDGKIMLRNVKISNSEIARAVGIDKRVVSSTIERVEAEMKVNAIFSKLTPYCNYKDVAPVMGWDLLEITLNDPATPGILGNVASAIGKANISIRQAVGDDPALSTGRLLIVTESPVPGYLLNEIKKMKGVKSVTLS